MGKKGILSNLYGVCEYIDGMVKQRMKELHGRQSGNQEICP